MYLLILIALSGRILIGAGKPLMKLYTPPGPIGTTSLFPW